MNYKYILYFETALTDTGEFSWASESTGSDVSLTGERDHLIDLNGAITQGSLQLTWSYSGACYQATTIQTLADGYQAHLQQLIRHGQSGRQGVTPSDFPLATVTQATLDTLYQHYVGLQDLYPLSPMQQGMLFHTLYEPEIGAYFVQLQWTLSNLDPTAFQAAWQHQLERHPILRTAFLPDHTPLLQVVQAHVRLPWREQDWRELAQAEQQSQLQTLLQVERTQGFDFSQAPLMRCDLIRVSEQRYIFIQHSHHILLDGWCLPMTLSEVRDSYRAFQHRQTPQLPTLRPYRDYIAWLQRQDHAAAQSYWQQRLAGLAAPTPLPIMTHPTATPAYREVSYAWSLADTQRLQRFSQTQRVTLNTLVQGAWALLLSRYSRDTVVCFGVTVSGRHAPVSGIEQMMGLFINTLPLLVQTPPATLVKDYLQQVQTQHQNDQRYAYSPLFEIQQVSEVPNGTALFDSLLVFENYPLGKAFEPPVDSFQLEDIQGIEYTNYPLTVAIVPGEALSVKVTYDHHRLHLDAIERLWGHFQTLLLAMSDHPEQSISQLPMLTAPELQQLQAWNDTAVDYPQDLTIVDLFEQQVARTPANIAVVFEDQHLTYQQLNDQANQLAQYLLARQTQAGIHLHNPLIAIAVERSLEMVIGLLGILKAGGAYVPIDPNYPRERLRYLLEDSAAPLLLTQSHLQAQLPTLEPDCVVVYLDEVKWANQSTTKPAVKNQAEDLAYVIYTSGSTGKPKGVMIEQRQLANSTLARTNYYQNHSPKFLLLTSFAFDSSVAGIFGSLTAGAELYLSRYTNDLQELSSLIRQYGISQLLSVPTWYAALLESHNDSLQTLKTVIVAGESSTAQLLAQHENQIPQARLFNEYGPTEGTVWSSVYEYQRIDDLIDNIGHPIANTRIYILDAQHQPQPPGLPGELCIAGRGLARGYLHRPELTADKFIEVELFGKLERVYKTGDLARWLPDGNLEYLGRLDHQIKLRGFRIELGEIEAVLSQHEAVKEVVVTLNEADGNKRLVAYLTTATEVPPAILKEWLKARLPDYMVPSQFVVLEQLPLTPNGKIDRKALPAPEANILTANTLPRDTAELQLLAIWETVLEVHPLGIHDNFFNLGGHSLLAVKLMSHIQQQCGVRLPVSVLFQSPTVATLAPQLRLTTTLPWRNLVPIQTAGEANPVYCLPGAVGSVMYLYPLASYLGPQQPCYALQTPGLDGSPTPATVASLARSHLQAVRQHQPTGPYQLIGHSSGGRVAFEMAWQLEQQGETVAFLAILDTSAPDSKQPNPTAAYTEINWLAEIVLVFEELTGLALNLSLEQLQSLPDLETAYTQVMQACQQRQILFAPKAPVAELKAWVNTYRLTIQGHADYQIPGKLRGPIHLFRAQEHLSEELLKDTRDAWGWAQCTHAKVVEHWVPGTHVTMMTSPHVNTLATQLSQSLPPGKRKDLAG